MKILAFVLLCSTATAQQLVTANTSTLQKDFAHPPESARPLVWWHWMDGNISKDGIHADLEWMSHIGLGGVQVFDAALTTPQIVDHRLKYMTPEWKDAFRYAVDEGNRLGLTFGIAGSPGWSETGGPWVPPQEAMKKYVWAETTIEGGKSFSGKLPHPPIVTGKFQNTPASSQHSAAWTYYADAAVVAFKTPPDESTLDTPELTSSAGQPVNVAMLKDQDAATSVSVGKPGSSVHPWLLATFPHAVTIRAASISIGNMGRGVSERVALEASNDGTNFREVAPVPMHGAPIQTLEFPAVTARFFRLVFDQSTPTGKSAVVSEFVLHPDARVHRFEEKAAFQQMLDLYAFSSSQSDQGSIIAKSDVIDLSDKMHPDGTLEWNPPAGRWTVLRIGYSLIGTTNHPATKEATGLEVDKLNRHYVKNYLDNYLKSYRDTVGPQQMGTHGIQQVITDSWEAGTQNWTDAMLSEFKHRRGYDPIPWLPVLAGHIVGTAQESDQFLWDFRKTIADLTADEHYGQIRQSLTALGLKHYSESHEGDRAFIGDGMEVKKRSDVPMSAMWTQPIGVHNESFRYNADDRESSSVAHIYGQNIAAAESLTAKVDAWAYSPATLKPTIDQEFLNGINRIVIHESTHQPVKDKVPGLTLGIYGQWFNRNETWASQARPWIDYIARSSYMLQQGRNVADVLYFYGEDSNITAIFRDKAPKIPTGYSFDYINADALIHVLHVQKGKIVTISGAQYAVLMLDPYSQHMSLPVLRALHALVQAGATIAGPKPVDTPSLADDANQFRQLANDLFGDGSGVHHVGSGSVYAGPDAVSVLSSLAIAPDFEYSKPAPDTRIEFVHRHTPGTDIYFVNNRSDHEQTFDARFRTTGKEAEIWRAETGQSHPASYQMENNHTVVPLHLEPWGSEFVVFQHPTRRKSFSAQQQQESKIAEVNGPWQLSFPPHWGAPESVTIDHLSSWSTDANAGIKYFSGAGTYSKTMQAPQQWFASNTHLWLDLGDVKDLAVVKVNGKDLGVVWHAPYRIDVTSAVHPGNNQLLITVYDSWVNRLIGDQQPNATPYTYIDFKPYHADSPLQPAGLLGPVQLLRISNHTQNETH